jgi:hypothetical protein
MGWQQRGQRNGVAAEGPDISVEHPHSGNFVAERVTVFAVNATLCYALE